MKQVILNIPTREDIVPTAKDAANAVAEAGKSVPTLGATMALGFADIVKHSAVEGAKGLKGLGSTMRQAYKAHQIKKAVAIVQKAQEEIE